MDNSTSLKGRFVLQRRGSVIGAIVGSVVLFVGTHLHAQGPNGRVATFEVASVKPNKVGWRGTNLPGPMALGPARFTATNYSLRGLIMAAYQMTAARVVGGPSWLGLDKYDIEATIQTQDEAASVDAKQKEQRVRLMLQALLAERFQLKTHLETRRMPALSMTISKKGAKLTKAETRECPEQPSATEYCHSFRGGTNVGFTGRSVTISDLADFLARQLGRNVVDDTKLEGIFDIRLPPFNPSLDVLPSTSSPSPSGSRTREQAAEEERAVTDRGSLPSLLTVTAESLGLNLEPTTAAEEVIVVDAATKPADD